MLHFRDAITGKFENAIDPAVSNCFLLATLLIEIWQSLLTFMITAIWQHKITFILLYT